MSLSRYLLAIVLASTVKMTVANAQTSLSTEECDTLKKVVSQISSDFALLKGKQLDDDRWTVALTLPGNESCYLERRKRVSYECESQPLPISDAYMWQVLAVPFRAQRADAIGECLGPVWKRERMLEEFFSGIEDGDSDRGIIVSVERHNMLDPPFLRTSIARMFQLPLEPPPQSLDKVRPNAYCDGLKEAIEGSHTEFTSLIEHTEMNELGLSALWKVNPDLSGWQDCYVHEWFGRSGCRYLSCTAGPVLGDSEANDLVNIVSSDVKSCLGVEWRMNTIRSLAGVPGARFVRRDNPVIEVVSSKSLYVNDTRYVELSVRAEVACQP